MDIPFRSCLTGGQTAEATSGASASAATNDDTGAKRGKKEATGKKE
jgi:hypothetical protein